MHSVTDLDGRGGGRKEEVREEELFGQGLCAFTSVPGTRSLRPPKENRDIRGNRLSNTTCLTQVLFKTGEACSRL